MGDSRAPISQNKIHDKSNYRCVICLSWVRTSQFTHIADAAGQQLRNAAELSILPEDYSSYVASSGMVQCPTCQSYFTEKYLVFSFPLPVLEYLENYFKATPKADRKPMYKVFELLSETGGRQKAPLPDPTAIRPYLGLYTLVTMNPTEVAKCKIWTPHLPKLSIILGDRFVNAPASASVSSPKVARIFDSESLDDSSPENFGSIPLSPKDQGFNEHRYWRIPVPPAAMFAALIERLTHDSSRSRDITLACNIRDILSLQSRNAYPLDSSGNGNRHNHSPDRGSKNRGNGDGGSPSRGGGNTKRASKRKEPGGEKSTPSRRNRKKARSTADQQVTKSSEQANTNNPVEAVDISITEAQ